jgi:hypothetical protein
MGSHEYLKDQGRASDAPVHSRVATWFKRNWIVLSLVMLAIAGLALAIDSFLVPCVQEAVYTYNEETDTNTTSTETEYVRLVPLDMHVALDHSGSMGTNGALKFNNAKAGISSLMGIIFDNSTAISQRPDVLPGSKPNIRYAFSKWSNMVPETRFALTSDVSAAQAAVSNFNTAPDDGTAISTGLAGCVENLLNIETASPTVAPTYAPTATRFNGTIIVSNSPPAPPTTRSCLLVTDGVAHDSAIEFRAGISHSDFEKECVTAVDVYYAANQNTTSLETANQLKSGCDYTIDTGLDATLAACATLGLTGAGECTVYNMAADMRRRGIVIVGMYVGQEKVDREFGQKVLRKLTSCDEPEFKPVLANETCPLFVSTTEGDLINAAESLANALAGRFSSETVVKVVETKNTSTILVPEVTYVSNGSLLPCACV